MVKQKAARNNPRLTIQIEDAKVLYKNFGGVETPYNRPGERNFNLILPEDVALQMQEDGWNVKWKDPYDDDDGDEAPIPHLKFSIGFKSNRPPQIMMISATTNARTPLYESNLEVLDWANIKSVDVIANSFAWEFGGNEGITPYVETMFVVVQENALEQKWGVMPGGASSEPEGNENA